MPNDYQMLRANDWKLVRPSTDKFDDRTTQIDHEIITPLGKL